MMDEREGEKYHCVLLHLQLISMELFDLNNAVNKLKLLVFWASLIAQWENNPPAVQKMQEMQIRSLG